MNLLQAMFDNVTWAAIVQNVGWLLIHSLWQCLLIALMAFCIAKVLQNRSSSARYWLYSLSLLLTVMVPIMTLLAFPQADILSPIDDANTQLAPVVQMGILPPIMGNDGQSIPVLATQEADRVAASEILKVVPTNEPAAAPITASYSSWFKETVSPWLSTIVAIWCSGVLLFSIRPIWGWLMVKRMLRVGTSTVATHVQEALQRVRDKMKVRRRVEVLASTLVDSPIVVGCFRSVILVPASFVSNLPMSQIEAILAHELAHVRRYDYLVNLLQTLVETLFFYHPAVWWLSHQIRLERENCCDDLVVAVLDNKAEYGRALLAVEEYRSHVTTSLALGAKGGSLLARVKRLLADASVDPQRGSFAWITLGVLFVGLAITVWVISTAYADEDNAEGSKSFVAQVTDEISVELLAVQPYSGEQKSPWKPNGRAFDTAPELPALSDTASRFKKDSRILFIRWKGIDKSVGLSYRLPGGRLFLHPNDSGIASIVAEPADEGNMVTLRVGITDVDWGPWQKVGKDGKIIEPATIPPACRDAYGAIKPDHIEERINSCLFCWTGLKGVDSSAQFDLVAITTDGKQQKYDGRTAWDGPDGTESAEVFNISLNNIDHFEYRLRPYRHWATFENVSLEPGEQTEVKVSVETMTTARSATRAGRWQISDDAELEIKQEVFHAADVMTSGVIRLHGDKDHLRHVPLSIAVDYFANRERWKAVWEQGQPVLWYAKGLGDGPGRILPPGTKVKIEELRQIDFSNPDCIVHHVYSGWVADQLPSVDIRTALEQEFEIKTDGQEHHRYYETARRGLQPDDTSRQLFVWVGENGNCQVQNLAWAPNTGESEHLKCELKTLPETLALVVKKFRSKKDRDVPLYAFITARPELPADELRSVINACRQASVVTPIVGNEPPKDSGVRQADNGAEADGIARPNPIKVIPDSLNVMSVGFDIKGQLWSAATRQKVSVRKWNVESGDKLTDCELETDKHGNHFTNAELQLSSDCSRVMAISDGKVVAWDAATGKVVSQFEAPDGQNAHRGLSCSADHSRIACGLMQSGGWLSRDVLVAVWDSANSKLLTSVTHPGAVQIQSTALSPDGRWLATGSQEAGLSLWDVNSGELKHQIPNNNTGRQHPDAEVSLKGASQVVALCFSPDNSRIAMGDLLGVKIIEVSSGKLLHDLPHPYRFGWSDLVYSSNGALLARVGTDKSVPIWNTQDGKLIADLPTESHTGSFSQDGQWFAVGFTDESNGIRLFKLGASDELNKGTDVKKAWQEFYASQPSLDEKGFVRNAVLDLAGVGASDDQVQEFVKDATTDKYSKLIDQLLMSDASEKFTNQLRDENSAFQANQQVLPARILRGPHARMRAEAYQPKSGQAVDGWSFAIALRSPHNKFKVGQRIPLDVLLVNASNETLTGDFSFDFIAHPPHVVDEAGNEIPIEKLLLTGLIPLYRETLRPGDTFVYPHIGLGLGENPTPGENWHPHTPALKPGKYRLTQSWKELTTGEIEFEVVDDGRQAELPWRAFGKVVDRNGKPLPGVTVRAATGVGTLKGGGSGVTDENGRYDLRFGMGVMFGRSGDGKLSPQTQYALISARLDGHFEQNFSRQGNGIASLEPPDAEGLKLWGVQADQVCLPDKPREVNFVMLPAAKVSGTLVGEDDKPLKNFSVSLTADELPPSSSVLAQVYADESGRFEIIEIPTTIAYQFRVRKPRAELRPPWDDSWASPPLIFADPGANELVTTLKTTQVATNRLTAKSLKLKIIGPGVHGKEAVRRATGKPLITASNGASLSAEEISLDEWTLTLSNDNAPILPDNAGRQEERNEQSTAREKDSEPDSAWLRFCPGTQIVEHTNAMFVSGVVLDEAGKPIPNCDVEHPGIAGQKTDAEGHFEYKQSSPHQTVLRIHHPEYRLWHGAPQLGDVLRVVLQKKPKVEAVDGQCEMTVRVIDSRTADPVPNVMVTATCYEGPKKDKVATTATTNEDGTAVLGRLDFIQHMLTLSADRPIPYIPQRDYPLSGRHEAVMLVDRACELTLRAVDSQTGKGIAGVRFDRERALAELWAAPVVDDILGSNRNGEMLTNEDGYAHFLVGPATWSYMILKYPEGYNSIVPVDGRQEVEIKTPVGGKVEYTFRLVE